MNAPLKPTDIPIIQPSDMKDADGFLFGFVLKISN
jgi:hypothetical protein